MGNASRAPLILTSALHEIKLSPTRPGRFTARARTLYIHWTGGWVNPEIGLGFVENRKKNILTLLGI
jgi:hypothetical protein